MDFRNYVFEIDSDLALYAILFISGKRFTI